MVFKGLYPAEERTVGWDIQTSERSAPLLQDVLGFEVADDADIATYLVPLSQFYAGAGILANLGNATAAIG